MASEAFGCRAAMAELSYRLENTLPRQHGTSRPVVRVDRRDRAERKSATAWATDHYEVQVYYTTTDTASLNALEDALKAEPGVYLTTQVHPAGAGVVFTNPAWPSKLGVTRRDRNSLRAQVIALVRIRSVPDA